MFDQSLTQIYKSMVSTLIISSEVAGL